MGEKVKFEIEIALVDKSKDFEVISVDGRPADDATPSSQLAELIKGKKPEFKNVQITMMRLLDVDKPSNHWCVVGGLKIWC
jgi:hypothetical protein